MQVFASVESVLCKRSKEVSWHQIKCPYISLEKNFLIKLHNKNFIKSFFSSLKRSCFRGDEPKKLSPEVQKALVFCSINIEFFDQKDLMDTNSSVPRTPPKYLLLKNCKKVFTIEIFFGYQFPVSTKQFKNCASKSGGIRFCNIFHEKCCRSKDFAGHIKSSFNNTSQNFGGKIGTK